MDKAEKTIELVKLLESSSAYSEASKIDDRLYESDGKYYRFHDVSASEVFYGFMSIQVPNPTHDFATQLELMCEIYSDEQIVKGCIKSLVIETQTAARKVATGKQPKMSSNEFAAAWDKLTVDQPDVVSRLKSYEHIAQHIRDEWLESQPKHEDGYLRIF